MQIERLVTVNFGQYAKMDYRFGSGVIGVVGPNAAGKSTLLEAIAASLTGEFNGPKAERIRRGADKDEPAFVEAHWSLGDYRFSVYRDLRSSSVLFKHGDSTVTGVAGVKEKLQQLLQLPERVIQDYGFIKQGELFGFLRRSGTERVKSFAHLCGVSHAEKLRKAIAEEISAYFGDLGEVDTEAIDSLHRRYHSTEKQLQAAERELAELAKTAIAEKDLMIRKTALQLLRKKNTAVESLAAAVKSRDEALAAVPEVVAALQAFGDAEDLDEKRQRLLTLTEQAGIARKREKLEAALAEPEPIAPQSETDCDARVEQLHADIYANMDQVKKLARQMSLAEEGLSECDRCGQTIETVSAADAKRMTVRHLELTKERAGLDKKLASAEAKQAKLREAKVAYLTAVQNRKNLRSELAELPTATRTLAKIAKVREKLIAEIKNGEAQEKQRKSLQKLHDEAKAVLKVRRELVAKAEAEERAATTRLRVFKKKHGLQAVTATVIEQAERTTTAMAECRGRVEVLQSSLKELKTELETVTKRLDLEKPRRQYRDRLLGIREACRYNQLPQEVILSTLRRLEGKTNGFLRKIGADFKIEVDDDLVFTAVVGSDREKAEYFSFGQKVMTALSFLLACNRVFAGACDFLALDEPSEYLDKQHVEDFAALLGTLGKRFRRKGRQLLVVTHNRELLDSVTQIVDLSRSL